MKGKAMGDIMPLMFEIIPDRMMDDMDKKNDKEHEAYVFDSAYELDYALNAESRQLIDDAHTTYEEWRNSEDFTRLVEASYTKSCSDRVASLYISCGNSGGFYYRLSQYTPGKHTDRNSQASWKFA